MQVKIYKGFKSFSKSTYVAENIDVATSVQEILSKVRKKGDTKLKRSEERKKSNKWAHNLVTIMVIQLLFLQPLPSAPRLVRGVYENLENEAINLENLES